MVSISHSTRWRDVACRLTLTGAHAARGWVMGDQPGIEFPRPAGREAEQQIDTPIGDGVRPIDTLVANDEVAILGIGARECALLRQHLEERLDQRACAGPGRGPVLLEQHPARAALDARGDPQTQAPGREILPVGKAAAARRERARIHVHAAARGACAAADSVLIPTWASRRRSASETTTAGCMPGRRVASWLSDGRPQRGALVGAREHAGDRAAGSESLQPPPQPIERLDARVVHQRVVAAKRPAAHAIESCARRGPGRGRVHDQHRVTLAAVTCRDQQRAETHVLFPRQGRDAQKVETIGGAQREEPRSPPPRSR